LYGSHSDFDVNEDSIKTSVAVNFNVFSKRKRGDGFECSTALTIMQTAQPAWYFNTSYLLKFEEEERNHTLSYKAHLITPWAFINYETDSKLIHKLSVLPSDLYCKIKVVLYLCCHY
jgi:hypothetical protein